MEYTLKEELLQYRIQEVKKNLSSAQARMQYKQYKEIIDILNNTIELLNKIKETDV